MRKRMSSFRIVPVPELTSKTTSTPPLEHKQPPRGVHYRAPSLPLKSGQHDEAMPNSTIRELAANFNSNWRIAGLDESSG
jgi:hypothetical protein